MNSTGTKAITQAELDAIPTQTTEFGGAVKTLPDGSKVRVPVAPKVGAMFDPIVVTDIHGMRWMVGTIDGQTVKRRAS